MTSQDHLAFLTHHLHTSTPSQGKSPSPLHTTSLRQSITPEQKHQKKVRTLILCYFCTAHLFPSILRLSCIHVHSIGCHCVSKQCYLTCQGTKSVSVQPSASPDLTAEEVTRRQHHYLGVVDKMEGERASMRRKCLLLMQIHIEEQLCSVKMRGEVLRRRMVRRQNRIRVCCFLSVLVLASLYI